MKNYIKNIFKNLILRSYLKENHGFSLIELIFVIAILSLISSISIPSINNLINQYQKNSYTNELISFFEFAKRESRRFGTSCSIKINGNFDFISQEKEAFIIECSGSSISTKKVYLMVPKLKMQLMQKVSNQINITPKGQIYIPNKKIQENVIILISLFDELNRKDSNPNCILINVPSGVISTGRYDNNGSNFDYSIRNQYSSKLKETLCLIN